MNITFERANECDAQELINARDKSFYNDYIKFGECPGFNIPLEDMIDKINRVFLYKIMEGGKLIGDISVCPREDHYWIGCLEIIPEYQNKGIGSKAIRYIEESHPEALLWRLHTPVQNERNCYFYEKVGYHKVEDHFQSDRLTLRLYEKSCSR